MSSYFCGKVLSDAKENNPAFDFTDAETRILKLKGLPVRIEHQDKLKVGKISHEWVDKRNHKWVIGKMDLDSYHSHYAHHGMRPSSKGHVLYGGLSLQHHVYRDSKGNRIKIPIEVSICREPRRDGCIVSDVGCMDKTARTEYKYRASRGIHANMSTPASEPTPASNVQEAQQPEAAPPAPSDQYKLDKGELMRQFVQTADQNEEFKRQLESLKTALAEKDAELKARVEAEMAAEKAENVAKAEAMLKAYESTLTQDELTNDHREAIMHLASKYPKETKAMFEVSCLASKKAAQHIESAKSNEEKSLEKRVVDVISRKRVTTSNPDNVEVHAASKKPRYNPYESSSTSTTSSVKDNNVMLFKALSKLKGSAHSHMERIAKYQNDM